MTWYEIPESSLKFSWATVNCLWGESIDFCTQCVIMTKITWSPYTLLYASFPDFRENQSSSKKCFKCPWQRKRSSRSLKKPLIYTLLVSFVFLPLWILAENGAKLKKLFDSNSRLSWGAQYSRYTEYIYFFQRLKGCFCTFLSAIALRAIAPREIPGWDHQSFGFCPFCNIS